MFPGLVGAPREDWPQGDAFLGLLVRLRARVDFRFSKYGSL